MKKRIFEEEGSRLFPGNRVEFLPGGEQVFQKLFHLLEIAETFIHIQMYILGDDATGKKVISLLEQAVSRGVQVFLMVDDFGTGWMGKKGEAALESKGIHVKRFSRRLSYKTFYLGRRQHSKIVVTDNRFALVGGMNIADRYSGLDNEEPWKDFALFMEGPVVAGLNGFSAAYWARKQKLMLRSFHGIAPFSDGITLGISLNDLFRQRIEIWRSHKDHFGAAEKEIFIVAAYFFPSTRMLRLILNKARQGVKVRIVLSSKSDVPFVKMAMEYYYAELLDSGAEIYEWSRSVLHGKLAIVDGKWLSIGSYNLNQLSDFKSLETNVEVYDELCVNKILHDLKTELMTQNQKVGPRKWRLIRSIRSFFAYYIIRISLKILFLPFNKSLF